MFITANHSMFEMLREIAKGYQILQCAKSPKCECSVKFAQDLAINHKRLCFVKMCVCVCVCAVCLL